MLKSSHLAVSLLSLLLLALPACAHNVTQSESNTLVQPLTEEVVTGIEVLVERGFEGLVGKKVALMTNPSGIDRKLRSTIDIPYNAPLF